MTQKDPAPTPADVMHRAEDIASVAAVGMPREMVTDLIKRALLAERKSAFVAGYRAGFEASGEGWNGEYPHYDFYSTPQWIARRDEALNGYAPFPAAPNAEPFATTIFHHQV